MELHQLALPRSLEVVILLMGLNNQLNRFNLNCTHNSMQLQSLTALALTFTSVFLLPACQQVELLVTAEEYIMIEGLENNLQKAVINKDIELVGKLLAKGANPNEFPPSTHSPLVHAILRSEGDTTLMRMLLNAGATPGAWELENTLRMGYPPQLKLMIEAGANIKEKPRHGDNFYDCIKRESHDPIACAEMLLAQGLPLAPDKYNNTLLHALGSSSHPKMVDFAINHGIAVNAKNSFGKTALHSACYSIDIARELISHGADVNAQDNEGNTPMMNENINDMEFIDALVKAGANPNIRNKKGENAVMFCLTHLQTIGGCDEDEQGNTIHWSGESINYPLLQAILNAGGNVNQPDNEGCTPRQMVPIGDKADKMMKEAEEKQKAKR